MPLVRLGEKDRKVNLRGNVWDHSDLLGSVGRAVLRSFTPGPWGPGDVALAQEMIRRTHTAPCDQQCFVTAHADGSTVKKGCHCAGSGWQYTADEDVMKLEGRVPQDVWNDARAILDHHEEIGRGPDDPILCDCDDLTLLCAAVAVYEAWVEAGCPIRAGLPYDAPSAPEVWTTITQPPDSTTAHAFIESSRPIIPGERVLRVNGLYVTDPARRWGMRSPPDSFYGTGSVARFRLRMADLFQPR